MFKKGFFLMLISILVGGMLVIFFLNSLQKEEITLTETPVDINKKKENGEGIEQALEYEQTKSKEIRESTDKDLLEGEVIRQVEVYDNSQMFFDGMEELYKYLDIEEIEKVKETIKNYIHTKINPNILDCKVNTIRVQEELIKFTLVVEEKYFNVEVLLISGKVETVTIS